MKIIEMVEKKTNRIESEARFQKPYVKRGSAQRKVGVQASYLFFAFIALMWLTPKGNAQVLNTVNVGTAPVALAINSTTNKIYVANNSSASVTVIDGATNSTVNVAVESHPVAVAVNETTNKIYVANNGTTDVTIIDGATNATSSVSLGEFGFPNAIAVNPATNKVYVLAQQVPSAQNDGALYVLDGNTNTITRFVQDGSINDIAVDSSSNRIYLATVAASPNFPISPSITVVDGATNQSSTISLPVGCPVQIGISQIPHKIYVADLFGTVTVIDPATNGVTQVIPGNGGLIRHMAIDQASNKIYLSKMLGSFVSAIDGATNTASTIAIGGAGALGGQEQLRRIYAANGFNSIAVINEDTNQTVEIPVGSNPVAIAANIKTKRVYVANSDSNNVTVIDGNRAAALLPSPAPTPVPSAKSVAYIANESTVSVVDLTTIDPLTSASTVVANITAGSKPVAVALTPDLSRGYVANFGSANVSVFDTATNTVIATVPVDDTPIALAMLPDGSGVYVANLETNTISFIDTATNTVTADFNVSVQPSALALSQDGSRLYVAAFDDFAVRVIATNTNTVLDSVSRVADPIALTLSPDGFFAYVANFGGSRLSIVDLATNSIVDTLSVGNNPSGVVLTPDGSALYVSNQDSSTVSVFDFQRNFSRQLTNNDGGIPPNSGFAGPIGLASTPDGAFIYVANFNSSTVSVISTACHCIVGNVPVAGAYGITIVPAPPASTGILKNLLGTIL
ncbi:MAG TPA: YncE family protein [Candidatus Angelobacter sp.]|nr:YncE family protein [Candidatus Angelobacter sp.]